MSISNTVTKVKDFDVNQMDDDFNDDIEINEKEDLTEEKVKLREEFDASNKSLDATQLYLGEIGFSPLLTAEEEVLNRRRRSSLCSTCITRR